VIDLVSYRLTGQRLQANDPDQHAQVQAWFDGSSTPLEPITPPEKVYPPAHEVKVLLRACVTVAASTSPVVASWLFRRHYDAHIPAGVLARRVDVAWWPRWWFTEFPIIVTAYGPTGELRTVHGVCVRAKPSLSSRSASPTNAPSHPTSTSTSPANSSTSTFFRKTTWPKGFDCAETLFLDPAKARPWFQDKGPAPGAFLFTEGATDYLSACQAIRKGELDVGVVGITSGSASALTTIRWPKTSVLLMAMDPDRHIFDDKGRCRNRGCRQRHEDPGAGSLCEFSAGARYEREIVGAVSPRQVRRINLG
jgi:hypothetical protein